MDNLRKTFKINYSRISELESTIQMFKDTLTDKEQAILSYIQFPGVYLHKRDEMKRVMEDLSLTRTEFIKEMRRIRTKASIVTVIYEAAREWEEHPESFDELEQIPDLFDMRIEQT
jgi:hypothetical protein